MNKKFSTLLAGAAFLTAFSASAQNALPNWYVDGTTDAFAEPTVGAEVKALERFDLSKDVTKDNGRYAYKAPLSALTAEVIPGVYVAFDNAISKVVPGKYVGDLAIGDWKNFTTPVYGNFDGGLGLVPTKTNNAEVYMVISTMGLSNPTNIYFDIAAAKGGEMPNRSIDWEITAKAYTLDGEQVTTGNTDDVLELVQKTADGTTTNLEKITYTSGKAAIEAESGINVRINEIGKDGKNLLANKVIVIKITNPAASTADGIEDAAANAEPVTVIKNLNFDFQRPEILFSETKDNNKYVAETTFANEFNAGAGYVAADSLYTRVEFYNPSLDNGDALIDRTKDNMGADAVSVYALTVKYPFVLSKADKDKAIADTIAVAGRDTTYYFDMEEATGVFSVDPVYNGVNGVKKYIHAGFGIFFAPDEVADFTPEAAKEYISGTVTAVSSSVASAKMEANSVPAFNINPTVMAFDEYDQTLSTEITVKNLPRFAADVDWIVNKTNNSLKPLQPECKLDDPVFEKAGTTKEVKEFADYLDVSGNMTGAVKMSVVYKRGNVSTDLNQSVNFQEVFGLNPVLKFTALVNTPANDYTGANLIAHKNGAVYPSDLKVIGNNQYVWFSYGNNNSVATAMGLPDGQTYADGHYERYFYAPFEANAPEDARTSRVDTMYIHAAHLVPNADNKSILKFAIHTAGSQVSNDFRFKAADAYGVDIAYFIDPVSHAKIAANKNYRGGANTDTLYFVVDLNNEAMVKAVKEKGLEFNMKYIADAENWSEDNYMGGENQVFKVTTEDLKADNKLNVKGLTDRGVVTNIYEQNFQDWYKFLNTGKDNDNNVYNEVFLNNYGTHYISTCISADSSSFIVAGINLIDPVVIDLKSNVAKSFIYSQDEASYDWGTFDPATMTITPNKYGEIYAKINVKFAPTTNSTAKDSIISEKKYNKDVFRKFIYDDIALGITNRDDHFATKFYGNGALIHETVDTLFHQRDNMGENIKENTAAPTEFASQLFEDAGFSYQADSIFAVIYGDAKKPAVKFTDVNGNAISKLELGKLYLNGKADTTIYMVGTELPFEDLTWPLEIASDIAFTNNNVAIYPTVDKTASIFDNSAILGKETIVPVIVKVQPDVQEPCNVNADLTVSVPVLCNVSKTIAASFIPAVPAPDAKAFEPGDIQGDRANLTWIPKFAQDEVGHNVTIGILKYNKKSSSIFISEVYADKGKVLVELFNGTASQLNPDIFSLTSPNYYLEFKEGDEIIKKAAVVATDDASRKILDPYGCVIESFSYAFKANTLYTVTLMQGNTAMDQFQFSTPATHMGRRDDLIAAGETVTETNDPYRQGVYDQAQWTNTNTWNMGIESGMANFAESVEYNETSKHATAFVESWDVAKTNMEGLYSGTHIQGLHNNVTYNVWVKPVLVAGMDCIKDENVDVLRIKLATSDSQLNGGNEVGDITFDFATDNEQITTTEQAVIGGKGNVTILNAAGKSVVITNVLGQVVARTSVTSDNATISVPAGVVVVSLDGDTVKAIVK